MPPDLKRVAASTTILTMAKEAIDKDVRKALQEAFKDLRDPVTIEVFTEDGSNDPYNKVAVDLIKTIAELSPKIRAHFYTLKDDQAATRDVKRSPTVLVAPDRYRIRFTGAPLGEEGRSLVLSIIMASTRGVAISPESLKRLQDLRDPRQVQVYVSPT
jgi:thioredoxin reductase (NADPH)